MRPKTFETAAGIAARQRLFDFIVQYKQNHDGNSPNYRQMRDGCGICSTSVVEQHLKVMERKRQIIRLRTDSGTVSGIVIPGGQWVFAQTGHSA